MKAINSLRSDCSTGYDNIPAQFVRPVAEYLASPMTDIINNCIDTYTVPSEWKTSRICPISKIKNPQLISEYRPIRILPILSKSCHSPATDRNYRRWNDARFVYGGQVDENDIIKFRWLPLRERISLSLEKLAQYDPSFPIMILFLLTREFFDSTF